MDLLVQRGREAFSVVMPNCVDLAIVWLSFVSCGCWLDGKLAYKSLEAIPDPSMAEEANTFYVVRKGDIFGVYQSLSDVLAHISSLVILMFSNPELSLLQILLLCAFFYLSFFLFSFEMSLIHWFSNVYDLKHLFTCLNCFNHCHLLCVCECLELVGWNWVISNVYDHGDNKKLIFNWFI